MPDGPNDGDVLITSEGGRHLLSVIPHPHRLTVGDLAVALRIAGDWARSHNVSVWHQRDNEITRLPPGSADR